MQPVLELSAPDGFALWPLPERLGDTVRLTVDAGQDDSLVIELSVTELRRLLAGAEKDPPISSRWSPTGPRSTCPFTPGR